MIEEPSDIPTVRFENVSKRYKGTLALDQVSTTLQPGKVYGLLGRNGAGKTTLMSILSAQAFPSSGSVSVGGSNPATNRKALQSICFIRENQKYPDDGRVPSILKTASWFFPNWNQGLALDLVEEFELPTRTVAKKLSRGQASALAATIGLASGAPITVFDEPYLGLDATARALFYRRLLEEIDLRPRTVLISSHLVDEIATLIEHVLLLNRGRLVLDESTDDLLERAQSITGPSALVEDFCEGLRVLSRESLGGMSRYDTLGPLSTQQRADAKRQGLEISRIPLQALSTAIASSSVSEPQGVGK